MYEQGAGVEQRRGNLHLIIQSLCLIIYLPLLLATFPERCHKSIEQWLVDRLQPFSTGYKGGIQNQQLLQFTVAFNMLVEGVLSLFCTFYSLRAVLAGKFSLGSQHAGLLWSLLRHIYATLIFSLSLSING